MEQGGKYPEFVKGLRLQPAPGSVTPVATITVIGTGLKDADNLNAVKISYRDASGDSIGEDIVAIAVLQEGINAGMEVIA